MTSEIATTSVIESVVIDGDLSKLTPEQRVSYYKAVCTSLDLNPLTRPFNYITLNGKLTLYATKTATDQLRNTHNVSIDDITITEDADSFTVIAKGHDTAGRSDVEIGVVSKKDMQGNQGNAKMKAVTKAKRRLTLSLCGLGMLDETEIETIPNAKPVTVVDTGEIVTNNPTQDYQDQLRTIEANKPVINPNNGEMTLEEALAETASDGTSYGNLTNEVLSNRSIGIDRGLKKENSTSAKQDELIRKLNAIKLILDARKAGLIKEPVVE